MVSFLNNDDPEACFRREVFGAHTAATATTYDHHIRLQDIWLIAWGKLNEIVVKSLTRLAMNRYFREPEDRA